MESLYTLLEKLGYHHPIHPPLTHLPIGMVIGALVFLLFGRLTGKPGFFLTARHCTALALVSVIPTALAGYLDWQHYYSGAWLPQIERKILLAALLTASLTLGLIASKRDPSLKGLRVGIVWANLVLAGGLGYFGGELVFKALTPKKSVDSLTAQKGGELFKQFCASCHPDGGNALKPHLPLRKAPQLDSVDTFVGYLRSPKARDGSATVMPAFGPEKLPAEQANELYEFVTKNLAERK